MYNNLWGNIIIYMLIDDKFHIYVKSFKGEIIND